MKLEKALVNAANSLSNDKIKVVAASTEFFVGLSFNKVEDFSKYLEELENSKNKKAACFEKGKQLETVPDWSLREPIRVNNKKELNLVLPLLSEILNILK